jgi:DNA-binding transcriptional MocR family regulator
MSIVYRKTAKGQSEIATRVHRLTPRLRGALILVDGQRSDADLLQLIPNEGHATLDHLVAEGFIEAAVTLSDGAPAAGSGEPAGASQRPADAAGAGRKEPSVETLRREAVRMLNEHLGPAAESLAMKIERSKTMPELRPLLVLATQTLRGFRGSAVADAFSARFLADDRG